MPGATVLAAAALTLFTLAAPPFASAQPEAGIPVTDPLVRAKCGTCHAADDRGRIERVSWARATPEGWQAATKRMIVENAVAVTPIEARAIVGYLSSKHGLAPEEARPVMYAAERRVRDESQTLNGAIVAACGKCHQAARALMWRRPAADWTRFVERHATRYRFTPDAKAVAALTEAAPLQTREWNAWSATARPPALAGQWLVTAHIPGRGNFHGDMTVEPASDGDAFVTRTRLRSVDGNTTLDRTGRSVVYGGTAWRGRSSASNAATAAPDDPANDMQEVLLIASDGSKAEGRWFRGQYQELGIDVKMQRAPAGPVLILVDPPSLKAGSNAGRLRVIGHGFPTGVTAADLSAGPGVRVRRVVSSTADEIVAEVDVAPDAPPGRRAVAVRSSALENALAIYDRIDDVKVLPDSSLASFGSEGYTRGYQQFEAIGYHRGPDGKRRTADDVELGPVDVTWSMEVFYEVDQTRRDRVGTVSAAGFFTPAAVNPGINSDVWVIATAKHEQGADGRPLVGKGYLVVTVPTYTFDGRVYVRDLDRWIEEGSSPR